MSILLASSVYLQVTTSVTIMLVAHPSFHIFYISRTVSRIDLNFGGTGIEKNAFASAGVSTLFQNSAENPAYNAVRHFCCYYFFYLFHFFYFLKFWSFIHCRIQDPYTSQCTMFPDSLVGYTSACCKLKCRIWYNSGGNVCLLNHRALQTRDKFSVEYWARLQTQKLIRINAVVKRYTVEPR